MREISGSTLAMAIQAIDQEIETITRQLQDDDFHDESGDLQLLLLSYEKSLAELCDAYEQARQDVINLPPCEQLIRNR